MSGIDDNSTKSSQVEEEISLDDIEEPTIVIVDGQKRKEPVYFECSDDFSAFDGDLVDKESSNS